MERQRRQNIGITLFPDDRILAYPLLTLDWVEGSAILFSRDASTLKHLHEQKKGDTNTITTDKRKGVQSGGMHLYLYLYSYLYLYLHEQKKGDTVGWRDARRSNLGEKL